MRDLAAQVGKEVLERDGVQHCQNGAVHLIGPSEVLVGGSDHAAMSVLQPVQTAFQSFHRQAAQVNNIAAHCAFVRGDQRVHQVAVIQNEVRFSENAVAQGCFDLLRTAHVVGLFF